MKFLSLLIVCVCACGAAQAQIDIDNQTCGASACDFTIRAVAYLDPDLCITQCYPGQYSAPNCTNTTIPSCGAGYTYAIVNIWDASTTNQLCTLSNCSGVYSCSFSSCGNNYTASFSGNTVTIQ